VSFLFEEGDESDFLKKLQDDKIFEFTELTRKGYIEDYYMHKGSYTVPPCTQGVT
jgi:carbonic anhydrase